MSAVKIVGVYSGELITDKVRGAQQRVCRTPGFGSSFGHTKTGGKSVNVLKGVINLNKTFYPFSYRGSEYFIVLTFDNKYDMIVSCMQSVVTGVIDDEFAGGTDGIYLFHSAVP